MHIVKPFAKITFFMGLPYALRNDPIETWKPYADDALRIIEEVGRSCYRSEGAIEEDSFNPFLDAHVMKARHTKMMRFSQVIVAFQSDRGVSHEAYTHGVTHVGQMESQRYCNYSKGKFGNSVGFIKPRGLTALQEAIWAQTMGQAERNYFEMLNSGLKAQIAADALPRATATFWTFTANLQGWRHFLLTRSTKACHPKFLNLTVDGPTEIEAESEDFRGLRLSLLDQFKLLWPTFFSDIKPLDEHVTNMSKVR